MSEVDPRFINKMIDDALAKRGGGNDNNGMEARVAKLEALAESTDRRISLVETDLRALSGKVDRNFIITWGGLIGLAGLMAKGFNWL